MMTGFPKQPTVLSILLGILLLVVVILGFLHIPEVVKAAGAALMFLPSRIGLIEMVMPGDVIELSLASSPTPVTLPAAGSYALYTNNYDLLFLHTAAADSGKLTWVKVRSSGSEEAVPVQLVDRGLALYDTPFARGRPMLTFSVQAAGEYLITHPTRPDTMYVVPDVFTGQEARLAVTLWGEVVLVGGALAWAYNRLDAPRRARRREVQELARRRTEEQREKVRRLAAGGSGPDKSAIDTYDPDHLWKKK